MQCRHSLMRSAVEVMAELLLKEVKKDPEKGLRKTMDYIGHFSEESCSAALLTEAEQLLRDPYSPWGRLFRQMLEQVEEKRFLTLCVNLGYTALYEGSQLLREQGRAGSSIPFWLNRLSGDMEISALNAEIDEKKASGICCHVLSLPRENVEAVASLAFGQEECTFFLEMEQCGPKEAAAFSVVRNVIPLLCAQTADQEGTGILSRRGMLYGFYSQVPLTPEQIAELAELGCFFGICPNTGQDSEVPVLTEKDLLGIQESILRRKAG